MKNLRDTVLENLKSRSGEFLPGDELSGNLNATRAAVWKQVQQLRREGMQISARPRLGYRLDLIPDRLALTLPETIGLHFFSSVDSTNSALRRLAEDGAPGDTTVIAEEQLLGRGRRGREWSSTAEKGLWFSVLLRPGNLDPAGCAAVTLVAAASLAGSIRDKTELPVKVKWPNDLLLEGRKICGILTELKGEPDGVEYIILGVGLNVNHTAGDFPPELQGKAGSLYIAGGRHYPRANLFLSLREKLLQDCHHFFKDGFAGFLPQWLDYNDTLGRIVTVSWPGGSLTGEALDLDSAGALLLKDKVGQTHRISYGEIV